MHPAFCPLCSLPIFCPLCILHSARCVAYLYSAHCAVCILYSAHCVAYLYSAHCASCILPTVLPTYILPIVHPVFSHRASFLLRQFDHFCILSYVLSVCYAWQWPCLLFSDHCVHPLILIHPLHPLFRTFLHAVLSPLCTLLPFLSHCASHTLLPSY